MRCEKWEGHEEKRRNVWPARLRAKRAARGVWGHAPPENFSILDLLKSILVQFGGKNSKSWKLAHSLLIDDSDD